MMPENSAEYFPERVRLQIQFALNIVGDLLTRVKHEVDVGDFISDAPKQLASLISGIGEILVLHLRMNYYPRVRELEKSAQLGLSSEQQRELNTLQVRVIQSTRLAAHLVDYLKYLNGTTVGLT